MRSISGYQHFPDTTQRAVTIYGEVREFVMYDRDARAVDVLPAMDSEQPTMTLVQDLQSGQGWWIGRSGSGRLYARPMAGEVTS